MRLLDLFCGAGGAGMGYHLAGFEVVGVDKHPQPHYPFEFHQADALTYPLDGFDVIHASPPCQAYSYATRRNRTQDRHPDLIAPTRERLEATGLPYVIENVPGAPLRGAIKLCGSSFRLRVRRHRLFESNVTLMSMPCAHGWQRSNTNRIRSGYVPREDSVVPVYGGGQAGFPVAMCRTAMGIDWMTTDELNEAIPPAYTSFLGEQLIRHLQYQQAA